MEEEKILLFFIYIIGDTMFLIAHRANNNHGFSENSEKAIITCLNTDYIDGIEIDVRITRDKKLILIHDPVIDFISDGHGIVKYMSYNELNKYKYGKSGEPITLLQTVLKIVHNKILLIELKEMGNDYIDLVDQFVNIIKDYSNENIYVCSFNFQLLTYLKNNYPKIKCGLIIGYGLNQLKSKNNFDFLVISTNNLELLNDKKCSFIFGKKINNINELNKCILFITDESYKFEKN